MCQTIVYGYLWQFKNNNLVGGPCVKDVFSKIVHWNIISLLLYIKEHEETACQT